MGARRPTSNILIATISDVVVSAHTVDSFTEPDWAGYLQALKECQMTHGHVREIVLNLSKGGPNASQRESIAKELDIHAINSAIMTNSVITRGMVTALSWVRTSKIKAFDPDDFLGAARHLRLQSAIHKNVYAKYQEFNRILSVRSKTA